MKAALVLVTALIVGGCDISSSPQHAPTSNTPSVVAPGLPNRALTPGQTLPISAEVICTQPASARRQVSTAIKTQVYAEYGIRDHTGYVIDHLIPLEVGGANTIANLWPQKSTDAATKDRLEGRMHDLVCTHQVSLADAQAAFASDWVAAYHRYVG